MFCLLHFQFWLPLWVHSLHPTCVASFEQCFAVSTDAGHRGEEKLTPAQKHRLRRGRNEELGTDLEILNSLLHLFQISPQFDGIGEGAIVLLLSFDS